MRFWETQNEKGDSIMVGEIKSYHRFAVSNDGGVVIRCCIHCGLSHRMENDKGKLIWGLILEEKDDETFTKPCPMENGSDDLFPYHHFILSNHRTPYGLPQIIRFCVRCGLSHLLTFSTIRHSNIPHWQHINENERDVTVSDLCQMEQGSDALEQRYVLVPRN